MPATGMRTEAKGREGRGQRRVRRPAGMRPAAMLPTAMLPAAMLLAVLLLWAGPARARQGDQRLGLFVGTTTTAVQTYTTYGVDFGGSYGYEFADNVLWTVGASFAATDGTATDTSGNPVTLHANTAEFQTGLLNYFNRHPGSLIIPYVGAGVSVLNYSIDYPGTTVGTTSGTAPGVYGQVGVEFRMTRNFTVIPQLGVQVHTIKTQTGASTGMISGGLVLTLRISS
jgi:outer membrane protein W